MEKKGNELSYPEQILEDWKTLLSHPWGRRLAMHLVNDLARVDEPGFDLTILDGMTAALHHARADGVRAIGTVIRDNLIKADRLAYILAFQEALRPRHVGEVEDQKDSNP